MLYLPLGFWAAWFKWNMRNHITMLLNQLVAQMLATVHQSMLSAQSICCADVVQLYNLLCLFLMYTHASEVNWICKRKSKKLRQRVTKGEAWKEDREKEKKKKNTGSLNVEKRPGIRTDTPHHTTVKTLTSLPSLFPPAITLSPSYFPSFHLLCLCTWPLHFLSLHFLSFTPLFPSLIISLPSLFAPSYPPPLPLRLFCATE